MSQQEPLITHHSSPITAAPRLEVRGLAKHFGGVRAVDGMDLVVMPGEIVSVIGPNGAGKTTLFNLITGLERPDSGSVQLDGRDITGRSADRIAHAFEEYERGEVLRPRARYTGSQSTRMS